RSGSLQTRFALVIAVAVLCFCLIAGAVVQHLARGRAVDRSLEALAGLSRAVDNTVAIGAFAQDNVLLEEVAEGLIGNELVAAIEIRSSTGELLVERVSAMDPRRQEALKVEAVLASPFSNQDPVGNLLIWGNASHISHIARQESLTLASLMAGQGILLALLIFALGARLVSRPVVELARQLQAMQPGTDQRLVLAGRHREDEIGVLVRGTNA